MPSGSAESRTAHGQFHSHFQESRFVFAWRLRRLCRPVVTNLLPHTRMGILLLEWHLRACGVGESDVSEVDRAALRQLLVVNYDSLSQRLSRRLGSSENAHDALHDTYLRLEGAAEIGHVRSPQDYLFRIALNFATDRRRSEARRLSVGEIDSLFEMADETPDASRVVEARSELRSLERAMAELPERRRLIFKAVLLDNTPRQELAKRFGITQRSVDLEVSRALAFGARHLVNLRQGVDSNPSESSIS